MYKAVVVFYSMAENTPSIPLVYGMNIFIP